MLIINPYKLFYWFAHVYQIYTKCNPTGMASFIHKRNFSWKTFQIYFGSHPKDGSSQVCMDPTQRWHLTSLQGWRPSNLNKNPETNHKNDMWQATKYFM